MKLLIVIPSITSYYTFLHEFCAYLINNSVDVHVATSPEHVKGVSCYREKPCCPIHHIPFPRGSSILQHWKAAKILRALVKDLKPDLVHSHFSATIFTTRIAREAGWPYVLGTVHGLRFPQLHGWAKIASRLIEKWAYRGLDAVWVLNRCDVTSLLKAGYHGQVNCLHSSGLGCNLGKFDTTTITAQQREKVRRQAGLTGREFVLIFIGRQVEFKGFALTVRAFFKLSKELPNCRLILLGTKDPLHPSGLSSFEESELKSHSGIINAGWQANVQEWLSVCNLNVFPSRREGMPVNLMESLAMGIPTITLNVRGCREVVRNGVDGVILDDDRVETLYSVLRRLHEKPSEICRLSLNAAEGRARFDQNIYFREQLQIYGKCIQSTNCKAKRDARVALPEHRFGGANITYVVSEDWYFQSHRLPVAKAACRQGAAVTLCCNVSDCSADESFEGITICNMAMNRRRIDFYGDLRYLLCLIAKLRSIKPDIIHLVGLKCIVYGSLAAKLCKDGRVIYAFAGLGLLRPIGKDQFSLYSSLLFWFLKKTQRKNRSWLIVQNIEDKTVLQQKLGFSEDRILLVRGSGVDLLKFKPAALPAPEPLKVLMSSRLLIEKGVREFAEASSLLREKRPALRFILAGRLVDSGRKRITIDEINGWESDGILQYLGMVDEMFSLYQRCHIAVLPSYYGEGVPKSLLEAAACGLPIITTHNVGCRDVVEDGVNGILIAPRDANGLAMAIDLLAGDADLRARLGRAGRMKMEKDFGLENVVAKTLQFYERILSSPKT